MKKNKIIHYDLKPDNILVYSENGEVILKICDMEQTKIIIIKEEQKSSEENKTNEILSGQSLTDFQDFRNKYQAPELKSSHFCEINNRIKDFKNNQYQEISNEEKKLLFKIDIYSMGILFHYDLIKLFFDVKKYKNLESLLKDP